MKNTIYKIEKLILLSGALLLISVSCVDLDENPKDFVGPDNFYNSQAQLEASFAGAMGSLYAAWSNYSYGHWIFAGTDQLWGGSLVFGSGQGTGLWNAHYRAIAAINPAIQALVDDKLGAGVSQQDKDQLMAQAKFIRAFNYFGLVRLFGDVPLLTEETNVVTDEIVRNPTTEVYALIEQDLLVAISGLPNAWGGDTPGRPTKGAAKTLLAKVYLTMATYPLNDASKYEKARDMAADAMDDGDYRLIQNIDEVFALENQYGPEMMWSYNATDDDQSTPPQIWLPGTMANGWGDFKTNRTWGEGYPDQPRKDAYLLLEDWNGDSWEEWNSTTTPHVRKFLYDTRENMEKIKTIQNIVILRYADLLMIFAEAENMVNNGPTQAAVDAMNLIIDRANNYVDNPNHPKVTTGMSVDAFDAAVIQERNLELCFEYDRWFDLIRKRILCDVVNDDVKPNCDENDYLFPIPQTDLRLNDKLTQNPGYPTP